MEYAAMLRSVLWDGMRMFLLEGLKDYKNQLIQQQVRGPSSPSSPKKGFKAAANGGGSVTFNGGEGEGNPTLDRPASAINSRAPIESGRRRVKKQHSSRRNLTDSTAGGAPAGSRPAGQQDLVRQPTRRMSSGISTPITEVSVVPQGPEFIFLGDGGQVNQW